MMRILKEILEFWCRSFRILNNDSVWLRYWIAVLFSLIFMLACLYANLSFEVCKIANPLSSGR